MPKKQEQMAKQQTLLNEKLKSLYNSVQDEVIPDRFIEMLERLEKADQQANDKKSKKSDD